MRSVRVANPCTDASGDGPPIPAVRGPARESHESRNLADVAPRTSNHSAGKVVDVHPRRSVPSPNRSQEGRPVFPSRGARLTTSATPNTPPHEHGGDHDIHRPVTAPPTHIEAEDAAHAVDPHAIPDVEIVDVTKRFGDVVAVDRMDAVGRPRRRSTSFLGPSGCGKTTTLRMIAGFEQPTEGEIYLAGEPVAGVPPYRRNVNTVFQHYALFPHMDVAQNVGYGLRQQQGVQGRRGAPRRRGARARPAAAATSGGGPGSCPAASSSASPSPGPSSTTRRCCCSTSRWARSTCKLRKEMQLELKALQREVGITFVYVTHDQEEALTMSDVIVVMRDGRIQQQGDPEDLYERPVNRFVADFIGTSNFHRRRRSWSPTRRTGTRDRPRRDTGLRLAGTVTDPAAKLAAGDEVTVAIRPEAPVVQGVDAADADRRRRRAGPGSRGGSARAPTSATDRVPDRHRARRASSSSGARTSGAAAGSRASARATRSSLRWNDDGEPGPRGPETGTHGIRRPDLEEEHGDRARPQATLLTRRATVSRRGFLAAAGLTGVSAALAACTSGGPRPARRPRLRPRPRRPRPRHRPPPRPARHRPRRPPPSSRPTPSKTS